MTLSLQELTDARETARNLLDLLRLKASKEADQPREEPLSACQKHLAARIGTNRANYNNTCGSRIRNYCCNRYITQS